MIRTLLKNLSLFDNWQTLLVTFLLEPFFVVLFFYLVSPQTQVEKLILTALVLTASSSIIGIYAQFLVLAGNIDILKEIFIDIKGFLRFNASALLIAVVVSLLQSGILLGVYRFLNFEVQIELNTAFLLIFMLVIFSSIFAMLAGIASLTRNNPYFYSNLLMGLLPIASATLIPITAYPFWLALLSKILPFWNIQNLIWEGKFHLTWSLVYFLISLALLIVIAVQKRKKILST
ncbi:MAG: hypothetical protein ACK5LM_07465 [Lactovum sp.]